MKQKALFTLAERELRDEFALFEFGFEQGSFYRELPTGLIHLAMFGLDPRTTESFRLLCGVTARMMYEGAKVSAMGAVISQHITPTGWDRNSGCWPCKDQSAALQSLAKIKVMIGSLMEPWFRRYTKLTSLANEMNTDQSGLWKAKLYLAEEDPANARKTLGEYRQRLSQPKPWDDLNHLAREIQEVDALLGEMR